MRTLIVVVIGLVIGFLLIWMRGRFKAGWRPLPVFACLWGAFCAVDTWYGVSQAGYGLREELMVHAVVFGIPMLAVWFAQRKK